MQGRRWKSKRKGRREERGRREDGQSNMMEREKRGIKNRQRRGRCMWEREGDRVERKREGTQKRQVDRTEWI